MGTVLASPPPRSAPVLEAKPTSQIPHFSQPWSGWFRNLFNVLKPGVTEDVVVGGVTLHFINGVYSGHD
jgi:hypothetical protein